MVVPRLPFRRFLPIIALMILAAVVRIWGIKFGLPFIYHVDEAWFAGKAINYFTGDLNPHFWHAPSLFTYLVAIVWAVYFLIGRMMGTFTTAASFINAFSNNATVFLILGRLLTVAFSLGTIYIVYLIGKRMFNERVGLAAALFLIFSPEHNRISHYLVPDSPMVFFLVLSFLFIWNIRRSGKARDYILAGACAGLAFATKYGGHVLFLPLFLAHLFRMLETKQPKKKILFHGPLIASGLVFILVFLVTCPYTVLDFSKFKTDFTWQAMHLTQTGHYGSTSTQSVPLFYLKYGFRENAGPLIQFLVAAGFLLGLMKRRQKDILLFSFPIILLILICPWKTYATRYMLPIAPFLILIAACAFDDLAERAMSLFRRKTPLIRALPVLAAVLLTVPSAVVAYRFDWSLAHKDTRTLAMEWIDANLPEKTRVASEDYCPYVSEKKFRPFSRRPSLGVIDLDWLAWKKVEYVVVSELLYERFVPFPKEFPQQARFYNSLFEKAVLVKEFRPRWHEDLLTMHNPIIRIYRLSPCPDPLFPGNYIKFAQRLAFHKNADGTWSLKSRIRAEGPRACGETVGSAYVRISAADGREIIRIPVPTDGSAISENAVPKSFQLPAGAKISLGYEYSFSPLPPGMKADSRQVKEQILVKSLSEAAGNRGSLEYLFLYAVLPNTHAAPYFQTAVLVREKEGWSLAGTVYGSALRYAETYVQSPYIRITDAGGTEAGKLVLHPGKIGSYGADIKPPVRKAMALPSLGDGFRVFAGNAFRFDSRRPEKAGGPEEIEWIIPAP